MKYILVVMIFFVTSNISMAEYSRISLDADGDGFNHATDNCPINYNIDQIDTDADSIGNACDGDDDNDGLSDSFETSIGTNPLLVDTDGDGLTDYEEVAFDGDATIYTVGSDLNPRNVDTDQDGIGDNSDPLPLYYNYADGDIAPLNSLDGKVNISDLVLMRKIIFNQVAPTSEQLSHADLYPPGAPDGVIDLSDLVLLQKRILE